MATETDQQKRSATIQLFGQYGTGPDQRDPVQLDSIKIAYPEDATIQERASIYERAKQAAIKNMKTEVGPNWRIFFKEDR
tara:strand:- start:571 stop:810 length:240 start_codon:yes stop_codon:yes gene_type:complete